MEIDLTIELATLMRLTVSDKWFIGKSFIDAFSNAILSNDIKKIRALVETYYHIDYPLSELLSLNFKKNVLSVFDSIKKKIYPICSLTILIECLEIEYEYHGWGDVFIFNFKELQSRGVEFINLDCCPYKYADGARPFVDLWCEEELKKNKCPFIEENAIDYFFEYVDRIREIESKNHDSVLYCFMSYQKGLCIVDRTAEEKNAADWEML
jgi:hypothetical protein